VKIFVSWSGSRSQALAEALRNWLPLVLHYAKPWLSKSDIQAGDRWSIEVAKELQESNFGIICVTKDNLASPWILFESGALAKSMEDGRVIPLLLDLDFKEVSGPLAQFQAKKADQTGIRELVFGLNKSAPESEPEERLGQIFDPLYAQFGTAVDAIPASETGQKATRPQGEILEELVSSVRNVEMRVRDAMDEGFSPKRRFRRRMHPEMLMDLTHSISDGPDDPIQILVFFSLFRDDLPWLYELALDFYRAVTAGDRDQAQSTYEKLTRALDMARRGPIFEMFGMDSKMMHMALMDAREFIPMLRFGNVGEMEHLAGKSRRRARPTKKTPT
jgi:hypothetical protein